MSDVYKIHLQGTAETQAFLRAEGDLRKVTSAADDFIKSLKQGVGIDLGGRIVDSIMQLPGIFTGILERGYDFNAVMAGAEGGVANVLAKFLQLDEQAAKREAAKAMQAITEWEPKAAGSLQDLVQGFMSTAGAAAAAGVTVEQNVELTGKFANALAALSMDASQLSQEMRAIFTGNITSDAALARTLTITNEDVRRAKEAGQLYEYLNKQIGALGNTAAGPAVVMSSLSSAIDKAAGILARPLFEELVEGAQQVADAVADPAIQQGLKEAGVEVGELVAQGVKLSLWALENAPLLLQVAEGAVRVGAAVAGIKLVTIIAGLAVKAQRWAAVTMAVNANTGALNANTAAATVNAATAGPAAAKAATAAGAAGGAAMGTAFAGGFRGVVGAAMPLIMTGLVVKIMDQAGEILGQLDEWKKTNAGNAAALQNNPAPTDYLRSEIANAGTPKEVEQARRLGEIMLRDAKNRGQDVLVNNLNAVMGAFDKLVGTQVDHKKAADDAAAAESRFNAALVAGQAAAGESAAKIKLATDAVQNLADKLAKASGGALDTSSFESLLKGLQGLDKTKLSEGDAKDVEKLLKLAGELRDLRAEAAEEAKRQADQAKRDADEVRQKQVEALELQSRLLEASGKAAAARNAQAKADALKLQGEGLSPAQASAVVQAETARQRQEEEKRVAAAREVAALEDEIAKAKARGDKEAAEAAQDRLRTLQLARQFEEELKLSPADARSRAESRVADEREAEERGELQDALHSGKYKRRGGVQKRPQTAFGIDSDNSGLRGGGSSLDAFNDRNTRRLRDDFEFPRLDAFERNQGVKAPGAATPGGQGQGQGELTSAAKKAASAAGQAASATEKGTAAVMAEIAHLQSELERIKAAQDLLSSQIKNGPRK